MITLEKAFCDIYTTKFFNKVNELFYNEDYKIESILSCKTERANFWLFVTKEFYENFRSREQKTVSFNKIDFSPLKENFSEEFIEYIFTYSTQYLGCDFERKIKVIAPYIPLIESIRLSPWQWYYGDDISKNDIELIYKKLKNLKNPFDDRFTAHPIHAESIKKGFNRSEWLKDCKGGINNYLNQETGILELERDESAYNTIFIDAKIGIVIYYKNLPSITISFNVDSERNLYVHQIQSQLKDRGHYKVKGDWRVESLNYLKSIFPEFKIHLISGDNISNFIENSYKENPPKKSILDRIKNNYDSILPVFKEYKKISNIQYRQLEI
jgi:hypothetical protein